jgi:hypothetical protein
MVNALDMTGHSLYVYNALQAHARNTEAGGNSSRRNAQTSLCRLIVFIFLQIPLYFTFSTAGYTWRGALFSQVLVNTSEHNADARDS